MQKNPDTTKEIKNRGYEVPTIITPTQELLDINEVLKSKINASIIPKKMKKKYVLETSRNFLDSHFILQSVPFYHETKIGPIRIEKYGTVHPFGLPVKSVNLQDQFNGRLKEVITREDGRIIEYLYRGIDLNRRLNELSPLAYTHELVHSQLNHIPGLIKDYTNIEFLSIFLETVQAYETSDKLLRIHDIERLFELSGIIEELSKYHETENEKIKNVLVEGTSYLTSTLKAYKLFIRYYYSTNEDKKTILRNIQRIFNHEISVEEFLSILDVTFENSQDSNSLKKYLNR